MNKERRKKIDNAIIMLSAGKDIIEDVMDEECDALDNIPENLQGSERYSAMEDCISDLEDAVSDIESVISTLQEV